MNKTGTGLICTFGSDLVKMQDPGSVRSGSTTTSAVHHSTERAETTLLR